MEDREGRGYECQRRRVPEVISKVCNSYGDRGDSGMAASHDHQEDEVTDLSCVSSGHIIFYFFYAREELHHLSGHGH